MRLYFPEDRSSPDAVYENLRGFHVGHGLAANICTPDEPIVTVHLLSHFEGDAGKATCTDVNNELGVVMAEI